ncbi:hypothetical protein C8Q75DRAFT_737990 [Abortiporus biennis]|nr:hypothetical protein C8Q75DRAFT_737990 [Abortiporus biennis]
MYPLKKSICTGHDINGWISNQNKARLHKTLCQAETCHVWEETFDDPSNIEKREKFGVIDGEVRNKFECTASSYERGVQYCKLSQMWRVFEGLQEIAETLDAIWIEANIPVQEGPGEGKKTSTRQAAAQQEIATEEMVEGVGEGMVVLGMVYEG